MDEGLSGGVSFSLAVSVADSSPSSSFAGSSAFGSSVVAGFSPSTLSAGGCAVSGAEAASPSFGASASAGFVSVAPTSSPDSTVAIQQRYSIQLGFYL